MLARNTIHRLDCIEAMQQMDKGCVDLAFADPPFNIGYEYDVYKDKKDSKSYLDWSRQWISGVHRALKPTGTFWLAIGDDYAAELKVLSQEIGFHCRSWVIWYYTFGVNCKNKFSRSHTHLFHFVKDKDEFTFNREAILIPSARQLVYADKRAAAGRLPDDTWILRPQDLTDGFNADDDVWYFPRVAGTFKEREGFHGCQMPEQLLGRIIKACSSPGELVLDPFSGSATTLAVAKKLNRKFVGFDISQEYIARGLSRLESIERGDPLDGSAEPTASAPKTPSYTAKVTTAVRNTEPKPVAKATPPTIEAPKDIEAAIIEAFCRSADGHSADRVVADPALDAAFLEACQSLGLSNDPWFLNRSLFRLRKAGKITSVVATTKRTEFTWSETDPYLFASEIAWRMISDKCHHGLDDIFCNPEWASQFDQIASQFAPGYTPLQYRWAAFKLRKEAKTADVRSRQLTAKFDLPKAVLLDKKTAAQIVAEPGLYVVTQAKKKLYVGGSLNLRELLSKQFGDGNGWETQGTGIHVSTLPYRSLENCNLGLAPDPLTRWLFAYQLSLVRQLKPALNRLGVESTAA